MLTKRREEGEKQNIPFEGRWGLKENIGTKACLPARCAVMSSKGRVEIWQEPSVGQMLLSTGKEQTCNMAAVSATMLSAC